MLYGFQTVGDLQLEAVRIRASVEKRLVNFGFTILKDCRDLLRLHTELIDHVSSHEHARVGGSTSLSTALVNHSQPRRVSAASERVDPHKL